MLVWSWLACAGSPPPTSSSASDAAEEGPGGSATCDRYLTCAARVTPAGLGALAEQYGDDGSCWHDPSIAEVCEDACAAGLADLQAAAPDERECFDDPWCVDGEIELAVTEVLRQCEQYQGYEATGWMADLQCDDLEHGTLTASNGVQWSVACTGEPGAVTCVNPTYDDLRLDATIEGGQITGTLYLPILQCVFELAVEGTWPTAP